LCRLLKSDRPELRYWGAVGFAALGAKNVKVDIPDPLRAMLQDPNGEVAVTAAEAVALQGDHEAALQALIRLSINMDKEDPRQYLERRFKQRSYAMAAFEMLTTFEDTVPLVNRYLELYHDGGNAGPYPFVVQELLVNLGRAPAASMYGNKTRREINTVRKPMGPLP